MKKIEPTKRSRIKPSVTMEMGCKVKDMQKNGINIVNFGIGEPDFNTPDNIKRAAKKAIDDNFTKYTPSDGIPELKEAVCRKLEKENGIHYEKSNIVVSCGAKHSLYNTMQAILEPGDEIIVPVPYWVSYVEQIKLSSGVPVYLGTEQDNDFVIDPDQLQKAITKKTKAIIINTPNNPSGAVFDKKTLESIADIAVKNNVIVISDEVYEKFVYDDAKHVSIASLNDEIRDKTITINAVSKTYAMTGWRIGYLAAPEQFAKAISNMQSHTTSNPTSISQKAALEAITGSQDSVDKMASAFNERRKYFCKHISKIDGIKCNMPKGAFYLFPNVAKLKKRLGVKNSTELSNYILEKARVCVLPGIEFGDDDHLRISYAVEMSTIEEGLKRLKKL